MSITLKIINIVDKLKLQNYFLEQQNRVMFMPIRLEVNEQFITEKFDQLLNTEGQPYEISDFERSCLNDLDF